MIGCTVHLPFFGIGLGLTPEAAWMVLDKPMKPNTIAAMISVVSISCFNNAIITRIYVVVNFKKQNHMFFAVLGAEMTLIKD